MHIVCFGDSLSAGFQSPTLQCPDPADTPYGEFLAGYLGGRAQVHIRAVCGERTDEMLRRFDRDAVETHPAYIIILGGTNDLGWDISPVQIMRNLRAMYEKAENAGIRTVAVTVPSIRGFDDYIAGRLTLNALIMKYCSDKGLPCVDLFTATAEDGPRRLAPEYSNDGLHLTTSGYQLLATLLYEQVFKSIL